MDAPQSLPLRSGRAVEDSHRLPSSSQDATRVVQLAQAAAPSPTVCSPAEDHTVSTSSHGKPQLPAAAADNTRPQVSPIPAAATHQDIAETRGHSREA
ncbi:hypothetical protein PCL_03488 [Purpureocillium lilacinum]|uniref:Uncharacterized protein n=1 Tax=Purpureocillium lilacinum TaxID=33203 RepID=A0A2U3EP63_PURLI|nr:hypothetical protein Purlil1_5011 [Purpureocillium lilacinum]PWI76294.1 hypothetical protein PCL_03488 [Purpureocillium lilacinum]